MQNRRQKVSSAFIAVLAATGLATAAQAANCGLVGRWHMTGILGFGSGQAVVGGTITIKPNGAFTGANCKSWIVGQPMQTGCSTGTIKADAKCNLSGVIKVPGRDDTIIGAGKVRGVTASLVGYRSDANSPTQVRLITLIKQ